MWAKAAYPELAFRPRHKRESRIARQTMKYTVSLSLQQHQRIQRAARKQGWERGEHALFMRQIALDTSKPIAKGLGMSLFHQG